MTIVITGSEGFLGRSVVARLAADGHTVIAVDRLFHSGPVTPGVTHHQADLEDAALLLPPSWVAGQPFTLLHLAWDMRRYQGYGIQAGQVRQFANLLDFWGGQGLQRLIVMGSAEEFGSRAGLLTESTEPQLPLSPYGWAKRAARDLAASWSARAGHSVVWLRPFIMYGPGQKGDMVIPFALESARLKKSAQMTDGLQQRDFVFIDDVVDAVVRAVLWMGNGFQAFNLGRGEGVRVADIVMAIARHYQAEALFELGARSRRPGEPDIQIADNRMARELLGWNPAVDWREGLRLIFEEEEKRR